MTAEDHIDVVGQDEVVEVVQNVDSDALNLDSAGCGQHSGPGRGVDVAANDLELCELAQLRENLRISDVTCVHVSGRTSQDSQSLGTHEAVGVRDQTDEWGVGIFGLRSFHDR